MTAAGVPYAPRDPSAYAAGSPPVRSVADALDELAARRGRQLITLSYGLASSSNSTPLQLQPAAAAATNEWGAAFRMPAAGRIVAASLQCRVTAAGGFPGLGLDISVTPEATGTTASLLTAVAAAGVTTGRNRYVTVAPKTGNAVAAGDWISIARFRQGGFAMTTSEHSAMIIVEFTAPF